MQLAAQRGRGAAADLLASRRAALALVVVTLVVNGWSLARVGMIPAEEHFRLGKTLYRTETLSLGDRPAVFRPPGFPAFVAVALHVRDVVAPRLRPERAVLLAHGCLLSLGALVLYLHSARHCPPAMALAVGALYAFHPLSLVLARALTYPTLHVLLVAVATLALSQALRSHGSVLAWAVAAGAAWGVATLVRPVSLVLPPFILLLARWDWGRGSWTRALRFTALFTLGMAVVIAPYTLRNYLLTNRLIVVNAQEGYQFWGLTASRNPGADTSEWASMWREQGLPIFGRISGVPYTTEALYDHQLALNDAFREEAVRNLRRDPWRVARNVVTNFVLFNLDSMGWWLDYDGYVRDGRSFQPRWGPAKLVCVLVLLLGAAGLVRGLAAGATHARVVATIYAMFCAAHCVAFMLARYNYVRIPLLLLALPLLLPRRATTGTNTC